MVKSSVFTLFSCDRKSLRNCTFLKADILYKKTHLCMFNCVQVCNINYLNKEANIDMNYSRHTRHDIVDLLD